MMRTQQRRRLSPVLKTWIVFALLLVVVLAAAQQHPAHHAAVPFLFLVPVFLFGLLGLCLAIVRDESPDERRLAPSPARPSLFQRPPPMLHP